jgi:hypothetical protein
MKLRSHVFLCSVMVFALVLASCGDDDSPTSGSVDKTPPGVSSVTPVDEYHIDVTFGEPVSKRSAEDWAHYTMVETAPTPIAGRQLAAPGDPVLVAGVGLKDDKKTVTISTQSSMAGLSLNVNVHGVADASGNTIGEAGSDQSFTGSNLPDITAPVVLSHSPLSDATDVPVNMTLRVVFSEGVNVGRDWGKVGGGTVLFQTTWEGLTMVCTPLQPLQYATDYVFGFSGNDYSNHLVSATWYFTTEPAPALRQSQAHAGR